MASQEGARRIKTVGKLIILISCSIAVIAWLLIFNTRSVELLWLVSLLITPVAFGGLVYALGWILEGYSQPPHELRDPHIRQFFPDSED